MFVRKKKGSKKLIKIKRSKSKNIFSVKKKIKKMIKESKKPKEYPIFFADMNKSKEKTGDDSSQSLLQSSFSDRLKTAKTRSSLNLNRNQIKKK